VVRGEEGEGSRGKLRGERDERSGRIECIIPFLIFDIL
jgi:hypothetical protein